MREKGSVRNHFLHEFGRKYATQKRPNIGRGAWRKDKIKDPRVSSRSAALLAELFSAVVVFACFLSAVVQRKTQRFFASRNKGTKSGRLRRPLCVRVIRVSEGWNALAHSVFLEVFTRWPFILSDDNNLFRHMCLGTLV